MGYLYYFLLFKDRVNPVLLKNPVNTRMLSQSPALSEIMMHRETEMLFFYYFTLNKVTKIL